MTAEKQKNMLKYSDKEVFLISDKNWKDVLPLVRVTTWNGGENCKRGTQTNVCAYPSLIYHEEDWTDKTLDLDKRLFLLGTGLNAQWNFKDNLFAQGTTNSDEFTILFDLSEEEYYKINNGAPLFTINLESSKIDPLGDNSLNYTIFINGERLDLRIYSPLHISLYWYTLEDRLKVGQNSITLRREGGNILFTGYKLFSDFFTKDPIDDYCGSGNFYDLCITDAQLNNPVISPGQTITYSITVENIGQEPVDLSGQESLLRLYPTVPLNLALSYKSISVQLDHIFYLHIYNKSDIYPNSAFDADSIIYFMQQYHPSRVTIIGQTPPELDNLLVANPELGVGLQSNQIQRITPDNYLAYWENPTKVVYVEDNYGLALSASAYASLINAPLIIKGTSLDNSGTFSGKNVICVGNVVPAGSSCAETYNLNSLQQRYVEKTKTNKIILINPDDFRSYNLPSNLKRVLIPFSNYMQKLHLLHHF